VDFKTLSCETGLTNTVKLGGSDLHVSRLGIGALQWGDTQQGYGKRYREAGVKCVPFVTFSDSVPGLLI
jgi:hypothetical protein